MSDEFAFSKERRAVLEGLPSPMSVYHVARGTYRLILVTDGLCRLLQRNRETIFSDSARRPTPYIHEDDYTKRIDTDAYASMHREVTNYDMYRLRLPDGSYIRVASSGDTERLPDGTHLFYRSYALLTDRDEEKLTRQLVMKQQLARYQEVFDSLSVAVFWKDENRRFIGANRAFLDFVGAESVDEIIGDDGEAFGYLEEKQMFYNDEKNLLAKGVGSDRLHGHMVIKGLRRDIVVSKNVIRSNGKIVGIVGVIEDVTAEYDMRRRANNVRRVIDNVLTGIAVYRIRDGRMTCIEANQVLAAAFGLRREELIGRSFGSLREYFHPAEADCALNDEADFLSGKTDYYKAYRLRGVHGYVWCRLSANSLDTGNSRYIFLTITDISRARAATKAAAMTRRAYETAVNGAGLIVWKYDVQKHCITMMDNKATEVFCERVGLEKQFDNVPYSMFHSLTRESVPGVLRMYSDVEVKGSAECEACFQCKDGTRLYKYLSCTVVEDDDGTPMVAYGIGRDITAEKERMEKYEEEISHLHKTNRPNVIVKGHFDLTGNRIADYATHNEYAVTLPLDYTYDEALAEVLKVISNPEEMAMVKELFNRENLINKFRSGASELTCEYHAKLPDLPSVLVELTADIFETRSGNVECFIYAYDNTQKMLEREIIRNFADLGYEYAALVDIGTLAMVPFKMDYGKKQMAKRQLYYDKELESKISCYVSEVQKDEAMSELSLGNIMATLRTGHLFEYSFTVVLPRKGLQRLRLQATYLSGTRDTIFIAISNITEQYLRDLEQMEELRRAVMEAEKANESRSMFLSSVSHDMRTPLNGIISFTNFALEEPDTSRKQSYLEKIKLSSKLLLNLINDTLELSRIESGKVVLKPEVISTDDLVNSITAGVKVNADTKNVELEVMVDKHMPAQLKVDVLRMQELCLNLLSNAVKFTPSGGNVAFRLEWLEGRTDGMTCRITVRDNGIGISKEFQEKLFEPFSQENAGTGNNVGSGLGLSIVKRYVQLMGGTITVDSEQGRGTTFVMCLPLEAATEKAASKQEEIVEVSFEGMHILLAEDNFLNAEIATILLEEKGATVEHAEDGEVALNKYMDAPGGTYDVILMDLRMPNMNGIQATKEIRKLSRLDSDTIPIVAMTADAYDDDIRRCLEAGMNGHVAKPVDPVKLFSTISRVVGASKKKK